jgi:OTU domain-containing protein 6
MDELRDRHRTEQKELKSRIQSMKKGVNASDKKKKKEIATEIALLQSELDERHAAELRALSADVNQLVNQMNDNEISNAPADGFKYEIRAVSKNQKKKEKKQQAERDREKRIQNEDVSHLNELTRIEADKLSSLMKQRQLVVHDIPSDGDCMYNSIRHQLSLRGKDVSVGDLRKQAADFMHNHKDLFQPFLTTSTGDLMSDAEFESYCDSVANSKDWGGHLELRALSESLGHRVQVFQADGPVIELGSEFDEKSALLISYHRHAYSMGEHYNSLIPK